VGWPRKVPDSESAYRDALPWPRIPSYLHELAELLPVCPVAGPAVPKQPGDRAHCLPVARRAWRRHPIEHAVTSEGCHQCAKTGCLAPERHASYELGGEDQNRSTGPEIAASVLSQGWREP
jgi:hypothetical protein